jgi:ubiquitin-activating enzyme E1
VEFEKDEDSNHHIDFIAACANLRARNYKIEEGTRHRVKMIAGKIIPAIATSTALIIGNCGMEIIKLINVRYIKVCLRCLEYSY